MRTRWLPLIITMAMASLASAQQAARTAPLGLASQNPVAATSITNSISFEQYDSADNAVKMIIEGQKKLIASVDLGQKPSEIDAVQAQVNYVNKLKFIRGLRARLVDVSKVTATHAVAGEYLASFTLLFAVADSKQPHFINDCSELQRVAQTQHFTVNGKDATAQFGDDIAFNSIVGLLCPKYSKDSN